MEDPVDDREGLEALKKEWNRKLRLDKANKKKEVKTALRELVKSKLEKKEKEWSDPETAAARYKAHQESLQKDYEMRTCDRIASKDSAKKNLEREATEEAQRRIRAGNAGSTKRQLDAFEEALQKDIDTAKATKDMKLQVAVEARNELAKSNDGNGEIVTILAQLRRTSMGSPSSEEIIRIRKESVGKVYRALNEGDSTDLRMLGLTYTDLSWMITSQYCDEEE